MNLFYQPLITEGAAWLDEEESRHCVKVLRNHAGDVIRIIDGKGFFYDARITRADPKACAFDILEKTAEPARPFYIHIAISPTKNADRIEWFVEKCVEIGIDRITLLECEHTERAFIKTERLKKIAVSAIKQSLKATLPVIDDLTRFPALVKAGLTGQKFIAFVDSTNPLHLKDAAKPEGHYVVLIGPEGDFSADELKLSLDHSFQKVSLGTSRLRTETAGVAACHILNLLNTCN